MELLDSSVGGGDNAPSDRTARAAISVLSASARLTMATANAIGRSRIMIGPLFVVLPAPAQGRNGCVSVPSHLFHIPLSCHFYGTRRRSSGVALWLSSCAGRQWS